MIERYQNEEMKKVWSEESKYNAWLEIEILSAEALGELGEIPIEDVKLIREKASFDLKTIEKYEQELKHDVVAFTRAVSDTLGPEKKWIHYGLTSTDVVDTAYGVRLKKANEILMTRLNEIIKTLKEKAIENKYVVQMGRTHGVHAELTTFGFKMALYYDEMQRNVERFELAKKQIEVGKISGAVGTYANINPYVQDYVCAKLGLESSKISTQTLQRDRHAFYMSTLALIGDTIDKMATEFRHLQRTEVREVEERFSKNQKGSSAMPHKKNPISSENLSGLSRVLRGYTIPAHENVSLWHERDISHSSVERIIIPDATSLLEYMLKRMEKVIDNLYVNRENMQNNINLTKNLFFSQHVLLTLIDKGLSREEAYDLVQPVALESFNNKEDFKVNIYPIIKNYLTDEEFENCFVSDYHLAKIDFVFERLGLS